MPVYDRHLGVSSLRGRSLRVPALDAIVVLVRHSAVYASVGTFQLAQLDTSVLKRLVRHLKQQSLLGVDGLRFDPADSEEVIVEQGWILLEDMHATAVELGGIGQIQFQEIEE